MNQEVLAQGLDLLVYGMGTVIVFLTLLVGLTAVMSGLITRWFPESESLGTNEGREHSSPVSASTLRILQAAIDRHRQ
jgi:oxaloacetate decarboxylase gamma subunit